MNDIETGKLVCAVISGNCTETIRSRIQSIAVEEWFYILNYVVRYNLATLFYYKINCIGEASSLPVQIINLLKERYNGQATVHLKRNYEIKKIIAEFNKIGVDVILLKGIYLANKYYDSPAQRPMCDVDLLVKESDINKCVEFLKAFGCTQKEELDFDECKNFIQHLPTFKTPRGVPIELHWKLTADLNEVFKADYNMDELWNTAVQVVLGKEECFVFKLEYLLIYLCVHIAGDLFQQKIVQMYDVYSILKREKVDYKLIFEKANEWNCLKAVQGVFMLLYELFAFGFAEEVKTEINKIDTNRESLVFTALRDLGRLPKDKNFTDKLNNKGVIDKIRYFFWTTFNKERVIFWNGKAEFLPYLYLKRIIWLGRKYTKIFINQKFIGENKEEISIQDKEKNNIRKWLEH